MGLSINYSGRFNPKTSLKEMIVEVEEIVKVFQWEYRIFETSFPDKKFLKSYNDKIYGICFTPPGSETVPLEFLSNGKMSSSVYLKYFGNSDNKDYQKYLYLVAVKTQYAGPEIHMIIVNMLKYISKKYLLNFKVSDEGKYWDTGDENVLREIFARNNKLLDMVCNGIQNFPTKPGESIENYFNRFLEYLNNKR